jgi:hypothetical protein
MCPEKHVAREITMPSKHRGRRGGSVVEFAFISIFLVPLVLGTMAFGITMIKALEAVQVARDAGHMYARGVDFAFPGNKNLLARLGESLGLKVTGGNGAVILSTVTYVGRQECKALGLADNAIPPNPTPSCVNYGHYVFTHRIVVGNESVGVSHIGAPAAGLVDSSTGYIKRQDYVTNSGSRADGFTLLPTPMEDGTDGFQAGQFAYLVETMFKGPEFPGYTSGNTYTRVLF